jgi:hypothetical protein
MALSPLSLIANTRRVMPIRVTAETNSLLLPTCPFFLASSLLLVVGSSVFTPDAKNTATGSSFKRLFISPGRVSNAFI